MKRLNMVAGVAAMLLTACSQNTRTINYDRVIKSMSLEDKAHFVIGTGMEGYSGDEAVMGRTHNIVPGAAGTTYPLDEQGVPAIVLVDGPAGMRIDAHREGDSATYFCTHFPIGTLLASTWNQELVEQVGAAIGEEVKEYGADVLLAPALNIHRNPLNGRNFEYYSEDPLVAGKIAAAYVRGVQSNGVGTSIKHFAGNNQETNRSRNDARISQRALREIYLKPFEIAVKESNPMTVMTSYNFINGVYTSQNPELITTVLRNEWKFEGTVMTDWFGGNDGAAQIAAGNDMLQPGADWQYKQIVEAVKTGTLSEAKLDASVRRILELVEKTPRYQGYEYSNKPDLKAHAQVTRQSALEGMVLLKNSGDDAPTLPLSEDVNRVALYGCTSYDFIAGGTGSGNVNHAYVVSLLDGFKNAGYKVDHHLQAIYQSYVKTEKKRIRDAAIAANEYSDFLPLPLPAEIVPQGSELAEQAAVNDVAVITIGRLSGEFLDRTLADFNLSAEEHSLIKDVSAAYHAAGKKVIVLLNVGGVIETASWASEPDAILCVWQAGQEGGNSVVDILKGVESPSGKLTMTWPVKYEDVPSAANFPLDVTASMDFDNTSGLKAEVKDVDYTNYAEGVYVGYRYYDSFSVPVQYPFGYGLSYTEFEYSDAVVTEMDDAFEVRLTVKNVGKVAGKEVTQVYVTPPHAQAMNRPEKELKAFAKTRTLQPGESETLAMKVKRMDMAYFNSKESRWEVQPGIHKILVASSVADVKATITVKLMSQSEPVHDVLHPAQPVTTLER